MFKLFQSTAIFSFARLLEAGISFLLLGVFTRIFEPRIFGILAILQLYCAIMEIFIDSRLNTAFSVRFYQDTKEARIGRLYQILLYNLLLFVLLSIPIIIFPNAILNLLQLPSSLAPEIIYLAQIFIIFRVIYKFFTNLLILERKAMMFLLATVAFSLTYSGNVAFYYIFLKQTNFQYWFYSQLTGLAVGLLFATIYLIKHYPLCRGIYRFDLLKDVIILGLPLIPAGLLSLFQSSADRYMLNYFGFLSETGLYATAAKFPMLISTALLIPLGQTLTPYILKAYATGLKEFSLIQTTFFEISLILQVLIITYYSFFLYEIYPYFVGSGYQSSYPLAILLLLSIFFISLGQAFCNIILVTGKTTLTLKLTIFSMVVNLITNIILIPLFHVYGAIIASIISSILGAIVCYLWNQQIIKINYNKAFLFSVITISLVNVCILLFFHFYSSHSISTSIAKLMTLSLPIAAFAIILKNRSYFSQTYYTLCELIQFKHKNC